MVINMEFCKKLKKLRTEKGISQQKLADIIFVSRSAVAKWENGLGLPSEESYDALASFFGVSKDFFITKEAEQIIINKNKKIMKMFGTLCAGAVALVIILITYVLFHPIHYNMTATCDEIELQIWDEVQMSFESTDEDIIENLIDCINATTFPKSMRIDAGENYPSTMRALLTLRANNGQSCTVMFCSTPHNASIYISDGNRELVATNSKILSEYIIQLLENETSGSWVFS